MASGGKLERSPQLVGVERIDHEIFQVDPGFTTDYESVAALRFELLSLAVRFHIERCQRYARYCESLGFDPLRMSRSEDLNSIPLIPSSLFKKTRLQSLEDQKIETLCTSSGTHGSLSQVPRDSTTMFRFLGSVRYGLDNLVCKVNKARVYNLGPSTNEARHLWFAYVMSILDLFFVTRNYVVSDVFQHERLISDLTRDLAYESDTYEKFVVVGAPVMFMQLFQAMKERGVRARLGSKALVVTAGGWKKHRGEAVPREEFEALACEYLGFDERQDIRDALNLVELNTVLFECEHKKKHVPPWLLVDIKDPYTLDSLGHGKEGIVAYYDPSTSSYPAFFLSDDLGYIEPFSSCRCGRGGELLHLTRRLNTVESRGCALKMASPEGGKE